MRDKANGVGWALAVWGIFSVLFGMVLLAWPGITLQVFLIALGLYLIIGGAVLVFGSAINTKQKWAGGIVLGLLSVATGLFVLANPQTSATVALYLIALFALLVGTVTLVGGVEIGKEGIWLTLAGIASIVFGFWAFINPEQGALSIVWLIGIYNFVYGILLIIASFKTKKLVKDIPNWV